MSTFNFTSVPPKSENQELTKKITEGYKEGTWMKYSAQGAANYEKLIKEGKVDLSKAKKQIKEKK